jgi:hypothetical protein
MEDDAFFFECDGCGLRFSAVLFEIARQLERVDFASEMSAIHIRKSDTVSAFCSMECRDNSRRAVMAREGVPIRRVDGCGPIAPCAKCGRPVDMTEFHVTYIENDFNLFNPDIWQLIDVDYLAVLCSSCGPDRTALSVSASTQCV